MSEKELISKVREACSHRQLDIPELKTKEGITVLSENLDAFVTDSSFGDFHVSALLIRWMNKVSCERLLDAAESLPAILDKIRKPYMLQGMAFKGLSGVWMCRENMDKREYKLAEDAYNAWKLPYDPVLVARIKEIGYDFSWYVHYSDATAHSEKLWIELIKVYPCESFMNITLFVYQAVKAEWKNLLVAMKETNYLPQEELTHIFTELKGEQLEFFRSVWCDQEDVPEYAMVENLLSQKSFDVFIVKKISNLVNQAIDAFDKNRPLLRRVIAVVPSVALYTKEWACDQELFYDMMNSAENHYLTKCRHYNDGSTLWSAKGNKSDLPVAIAFKTLFPTDEKKREFLLRYPLTAIKSFYALCPKNIREDLSFWLEIYRAGQIDLFKDFPKVLKQNQEFLRQCCLVRKIDNREFNAFFVYDSQEALDFALAHNEVMMAAVPKELLTRKNLYRLMENYYDNIGKIDIALFSDEKFVLGAADYDISPISFYRQVDKKLRKDERVWKRWVTAESLKPGFGSSSILEEVPDAAKKQHAFIEHVTSLSVIEYSWKLIDLLASVYDKYPDLQDKIIEYCFAALATVEERTTVDMAPSLSARFAKVKKIADGAMKEKVIEIFKTKADYIKW